MLCTGHVTFKKMCQLISTATSDPLLGRQPAKALATVSIVTYIKECHRFGHS